MATFYNQATLSYSGISTASNIVQGELQVGITLTKTAASADYARGDGITYIITVKNEGNTAYTGLSLIDNLGAFLPATYPQGVVPLTYVDGSLLYFINGNPAEAPTVTAGAMLSINGINIPAVSTATIIYEARVNEYASLGADNQITNTVTLRGGGLAEDQSASATVPVREQTGLTIAKAICPAVIGDNGNITYTFVIQNTGNAASGDDLTVTDLFTPILNGITVTLNGEPLSEGVDYTYNDTTGEFATVAGAISIPAATFTRNTDTGAVQITPGSAVLLVSGTV